MSPVPTYCTCAFFKVKIALLPTPIALNAAMLSTFFVSIGLAEPFFQIRIFWIWSLLAFVTLMVYTVLAAWLSAAISYWCVPLAPVVCVLTALLPTKMFLVVLLDPPAGLIISILSTSKSNLGRLIYASFFP